MDQFPPAGELVPIDSIEDAISLLDEWIRAQRRAEWQYHKARNALEHANAAAMNDLALEQAEQAYRERMEKVPF